MDNKRFERIASALIREVIAKQMVADENVFVVIDEEGAQEVSEGQFNKIFASARIVEAGNKKKNQSQPQKQKRTLVRKTQITVSPEINATNKSSGNWFKRTITKIKNQINTWLQKLYAQDYIDKIVTEYADESRKQHLNDKNKKTRTFPIGYSIETVSGSYPSLNKETGEIEKYRETSYIITFYGISDAETNRIAEALRVKFRQEKVIIDWGEKSGEFLPHDAD